MDSDRRSTGDRRGEFKFQGLTPDELRRRREETTVEIRKTKREDSLNKRRTFLMGAAEPAVEEQSKEPEDRVDARDIPRFLAGLYTEDLLGIVASTKFFRKLISRGTSNNDLFAESEPPIDEVIATGAIPRFVELVDGKCLQASSEADHQLVQKVQFEAAWVLTNVASGNYEQACAVMSSNAVSVFIDKLVSPVNVDLTEQCVWALGNLAGDNVKYRDHILQSDIMFPLLTIIHGELSSATPRVSLIRNATWALSNLCRGKPLPHLNQIEPAMPILATLIQTNDDEIIVDTCWSFAFISDADPMNKLSGRNLDLILKSGAIRHLVRHLGYPQLYSSSRHTNASAQLAALRTVGNIISGNDEQTQAAIDAGVLPYLKDLLQHQRSTIRKETCWAVSNITAGTPSQIRAVLETGIFPILIDHLKYSDMRVKKEACWAVCNAITVIKSHHEILKYSVITYCRYMVQNEAVEAICDILVCPDHRTILIALEGLETILKSGMDEAIATSAGEINPYAQLVEECGGLDRLIELQTHANEKVFEKARQLIEKFFNGVEEDEFSYEMPEGDNPESTNNGAFNF